MAISQDEPVFKLSVVLGRQIFQSDRYSPRPDRVPHHIVRLDKNVPTNAGDIVFFTLIGKQDETFCNVLNLLLNDPRARNHTRRQKRKIREEVLDYCREIIRNRENIQNDQDIEANIENRARAFLHRVLLPEQEWRVISPIDSLSLERRTEDGITISNQVRINWFDMRFITEFTGELDSAFQQRLQDHLQGRVCVFVFSVMAIDQAQAIERAKEMIDEALHIIRGYFGTRLFYNLPSPNMYVAINRNPQRTMGASFPIHNEGCNIPADEEADLTNYISNFSDLFNGTMPEPISSDLLRAISWFGSAVQDKELEDKLVKYIFALETLLVPEERGAKSKKLVQRLELLELRFSGRLPYPEFGIDLEHLYQKRSNIVHGMDLEKDPVTTYDIQLLESITRGVIFNLCRVITGNQVTIRNRQELIDWIDPDQRQNSNISTMPPSSFHCARAFSIFSQTHHLPFTRKSSLNISS